MGDQQALALHIVREHFGSAVECVFGTLVRHGRLSARALLNELPRAHFDPNTMFHILAILLQQNLLTARRVRGTILYSVDPDAAVNRLRFPHFMELVKNRYPAEGEEIFRVLLLNGRLGAESVCRHAALKLAPAGRDDPAHPTFKAHLSKIRDVFREMLRDGFLARVEPLDDNTVFNFSGKRRKAAAKLAAQAAASSSSSSSSSRSASRQGGAAAARSGGARGGKAKGSGGGAEPKKKKARAPAQAVGFAAIMGLLDGADGKKKKKKKKKKLQSDAAGDDADSAKAKRARGGASPTGGGGKEALSASATAAAAVSAKRKHSRAAAAASEAAAEVALLGRNSDLKRWTFRCNIELCLREMERRILIGQMAMWSAQAGGGSASALAKSGREFLPNVFHLADKRASDANDPDVLSRAPDQDRHADGYDARIAEANRTAGSSRIVLSQRELADCCGRATPSHAVNDLMRLLQRRGALRPLTTSSGPGIRFQLDTQAILHEMVMQTVYDVLHRKFNLFGQRIFRLLLRLKYAEEKDIGRQAMLSVRDTRSTLYQLLKQDFVAVQEVPKRADRNVKQSFFLWYVDMPRVLASMRDQCRQSILRLRVKRQLLFDSNQVLMQRKQRGVEVNEEERNMFQQFMTSLGSLDESVLNTDTTYMLFQFYHRHEAAKATVDAADVTK